MPETLIKSEPIVAGDDCAYDFYLTYGTTWSVVDKRGDPVALGDVDRVFFYIKDKQSSASAFVELSDESSDEIEWISESGGHIRAYIPGSDTLNKAGVTRYWEVKVVIGGKYFCAQRGIVDIQPTATGRPSTS